MAFDALRLRNIVQLLGIWCTSNLYTLPKPPRLLFFFHSISRGPHRIRSTPSSPNQNRTRY